MKDLEPFNPIGFLKILSPRQLKKWEEEAHKREALAKKRQLAKARKRAKGRTNEAREKAKRESLKIEALRVGSLDPGRKAKCKCVNRGFYRPKPPSPTGKTIGTFKIDRSKIRKPFSDE